MRRVSVLRWAMSCALGLCVAASTARAQTVPPAIAPFMDDATLGVVEVDVPQIGFKATAARLVELLKLGGLDANELGDVEAGMNGGAGMATDWTAGYTKAGGGKAYLIWNFAQNNVQAFGVIPVEANGDAAALVDHIKTLLDQLDGPAVVEKVGKVVVIGQPKDVRAAKFAAQNENPVIRKDIAAALAQGKGAIRFAFAPPLQLKNALTVAQPKLPPEFGGGATDTLTNAFRHATLSIELPSEKSNRLAASLVIQASDAAGAKKLLDAAETGVKMANEPGQVQLVEQVKKVAWLRAEGDQLRFDLEPAKIEEAMKLAVPAMKAARIQANRVKSASNMRQLLIGVAIYASEKNQALPNKLPDDIYQHIGGENGVPYVWVSPTHPEANPPYIYIRAAEKMSAIKEPSKVVILHENYTKWAGGVNVGFADGHVEWIDNEAQFKKLLENK